MHITALDHLVLTVADIDRSIAFYTQLLDMRPVSFANGRRALVFGDQKINLHQKGAEIAPYAAHPQPGSADLCFRVEEPVEVLCGWLRARGIECTDPVDRTGARSRLRSVYLRDPDGNLIELANEMELGCLKVV